MRRRGLALILVVGVLGVLAVLGSAFAILSRLEKKSARQRVYATQALLLARSGVEDALARLDLGQDSLYGGEDFYGNGTFGGVTGAPNQVYRATELNLEPCPVAQALRPSFFARDSLGAPLLQDIQGRKRARSGKLASGQYALKVLTGGGFHVNGGDPSQDFMAGTCNYNGNLRRVLGTLAEALDREDGTNNGIPVDQADGEALIDFRPLTSRGWESYEQIRDLAFTGTLAQRQAKLDALKPYLSLRAWVDKKVMALPPPVFVGDPPPNYGLERTVGWRVVGRAPVDFAWARRRRPALIALLGSMTIGGPALLNWAQPTDDCRQIADAIWASTSEIRTWGQWDAFCDNLMIPNWVTAEQDLQAKRAAWTASLAPFTNNVNYDLATGNLQGALGADPAPGIRDLLKVHFNPNTDFNLFGSDRSLTRQMNKTDIVMYSTEFALRSAGGERISSVGRVLDPRGRLLASRTLSGARPFRNLLRLTTQSEFVAENLGKLDEVGDESSWRAYGASPYITPGFGSGFGNVLNGTGGFSLQTYPEPHVVWTSPGTGKPAWYDGQVRLATTESVDDATACFLASWPDTYDATRSNGTPTAVLDAQHPPIWNPIWDSSTSSIPATNRGVMRPDGFYVIPRYAPGYAAAGGFPPFRGVLSCWLKPNYRDVVCYSAADGNGGNFCGWSDLFNNTHVDAVGNTAMFLIPSCPVFEKDATSGGPPPAFGFLWENKYGNTESTLIRQESIGQAPRQAALTLTGGHRWCLLTAAWDMKQSDRTLCNRLFVNAGGPATTLVYPNGTIDTTNPVDFSAPPYAGAPAALFHLSSKSTAPGSAALTGCILDEFEIYDLDLGFVDPAILAQNRFKDGRYYKPSYYVSGSPTILSQTPGWTSRQAGEWFSAPINLGAGARVLGLSWTQVIPDELKGNSRIAMDLTNTAANAYAKDASGVDIRGFRLQDAWSPLDRTVKAPFRLHAVFQPLYNVTSAVRLNTPILDALTLDDVTLAFRPGVIPPFGAWTEGE